MLQFCSGFIALRDVHVHLVAVEVGIVGGADRQVQSESIVGKDSDPMTHHTHSMEGGLSVEKNVVTILKGSLDDGTEADIFGDFFRSVIDLH